MIVGLDARIRFAQKYTLYPDRRYSYGAKGPTVRLSYRGAYEVLGGDVSYHKLAASLEDIWQLGLGGSLGLVYQWRHLSGS